MSLATRLRRAVFPLKLGGIINARGRRLAPRIVITGASEGLGKAFASYLAPRANIVLIARHAADLESAAKDIRRTSPHVVLKWLAVDISADDAPQHVRAFLDRNDLYLDVLINNAATASGGRFDLQNREIALQIVDLNIRGLVTLTREFLPDMRERQTGGIINLASVAAFTPGPWQALYFASKSFVLSFSLAIAQENQNCFASWPPPLVQSKQKFTARCGPDLPGIALSFQARSPTISPRRSGLRLNEAKRSSSPALSTAWRWSPANFCRTNLWSH